MRRFVFVFALFLVLGAALPAQTAKSYADVAHLHVQLVVPQSTLYPGGPNSAGLYFKLEPGWHVYWQNAGDSGEPPRINWTLPEGITAGALQFPAPKRLPLGPLMDFGYEDEVLFPFSFDVSKSVRLGPAILDAKAAWLVCREVCIPGKAELSMRVMLAAAAPASATTSSVDESLWKRGIGTLPAPLPSSDKANFQPTQTDFRLGVTTGRRETNAVFFPEDQNIIDNPSPQKLSSTKDGLVLELKRDANLQTNPAQLKGILELAGGRNYELTALPGTVAMPPAAAAVSVAQIFRAAGLALLGGMLLNLMPCVFPVLFLKGLSLVQSGSEERHTLRRHGFVYTSGILVSFWLLVAVLLVLRAAGASLGWGFQFQSPVFLMLMAGLLFFMGLALAGQFEIGLSLTGAGGSLLAKQGYAGSFFTGVLAVIVATPCTAPFMGAALGYAIGAPVAVTFAVFTALALGLAAPYVALTLQPAWTRFLPRPGAWMEVLKQAVSVPIFATVIWLAWVVASGYGAELLAALLGSFLLLAISGWFLGRWPARRWATVVAVLIVACMVGLSVYSADALVPSKVVYQIGDVEALNALPIVRGSNWQPWSADAVQKSLASGQPVFVDFTASWCLSCQVNERVALSRPEVAQAFAAKNVALFRADWTREDPAITQALTDLGRSGVPVYALYSPGQSDPVLLPQVLTPGIVTDAINSLPATKATSATSKQ
jgi:thiol:disulfide interchange protein DsbD